MNSNHQCLTHTRALSLPGRALAQLEASAKRAGTNDRVVEQNWSVHDKAAQLQTAELHVRPLGCRTDTKCPNQMSNAAPFACVPWGAVDLWTGCGARAVRVCVCRRTVKSKPFNAGCDPTTGVSS